MRPDRPGLIAPCDPEIDDAEDPLAAARGILLCVGAGCALTALALLAWLAL